MEYKTTFEECKKTIKGVCSSCGGKLEPIETVDNAGNPTFWAGCLVCSYFDNGVPPEIYKIAKEMVEIEKFRPYSHINHDPNDNEIMKQYKIKYQIKGACEIVASVLRIYLKKHESKQ